MAIFIAILGLVSLSSGFSLIVVMVLYIEREFVLYIDGFVLIVEGFGLFFCVDFVGVSGSCCILRIYETRTEFVISAYYLKDLGFSNVLHSLIRVEILQYLSKS